MHLLDNAPLQHKRHKIVFLGTPQVANLVLQELLANESLYQVVLVVSQPPARTGRSSQLQLSPVHSFAIAKGIPVLTPQSAKEPEFLEQLRQLDPDLCITAAYGNFLPSSFLQIPHFGTLNVHPSLLPKYRGAAPVQRALEAGDKVTGVTVLQSVKAMDAGPILAQVRYELSNDVQAPELLNVLFKMGVELLVEHLPAVFRGQACYTEQQHEKAIAAPKLLAQDRFLNIQDSAWQIHNKVRAYCQWPGAFFRMQNGGDVLEIKLIKTCVPALLPADVQNKLEFAEIGQLCFFSGSFFIRCGEGSVLQLCELQPQGKRAMHSKEFWNGLRLKILSIVPWPSEQ